MPDPFETMSEDDRLRLSTWVTEDLQEVLSISDISDVLRVFCGEKPGAIVTTSYHAETGKPYRNGEFIDKEYRKPDILPRFLDEFEIDYHRTSRVTQPGAAQNTLLTSFTTYLSRDAVHLEQVPTDEKLSAKQLGHFLGYPSDAIEAYSDENVADGEAHNALLMKGYHISDVGAKDLAADYFHVPPYTPAPTPHAYAKKISDGRHIVSLWSKFDATLNTDNLFINAFRDQSHEDVLDGIQSPVTRVSVAMHKLKNTTSDIGF